MSGSFVPILAAGTQDWLIYSMGALAVGYLVLRPLMRKKKPDPLERRPNFGLSHQRGVERDMQNLLVELSEMARQVSGQLDTRAARLDALLHEADEKIAELRRLTAHAPAESPFPPVGTRHEPPPANPPPTLHDSEPRHRDVYHLADAGRSIPEIAHELGRPRGEVELILALRPR